MNNRLKEISLLIAMVSFGLIPVLNAQIVDSQTSLASASIEECYQWSDENYPLIQQLDIIDQTTQFSLSNASSGNLPQINLNGQATYQSEVTQIPIDNPSFEIPTLDKDQYKMYGEVYMPLSNFSNVKTQKSLIENKGAIEKQTIKIDLYKLKDRVNQIFFGALLINDQIKQFRLIQNDLDSAIVRIEAGIVNGTATLTDKQLLQVEYVSIDQKINESKSNKLAFLKMLSMLTNKSITEQTELIKPAVSLIPTSINRPELKLFDLQNQSIELQKQQINNGLLPNVGLFVQGGVGRPALNFLSNEFEFYYIGGIKFNWNLSNFYNSKKSKKSLELTKGKIKSNREAFLLNTNLTQVQQSAEVKKYEDLIASDQAIINLREAVLATAKVQLNHGLITTIDYVKILNDVNKAKQTLLLHQTQLLLIQHDLKTTLGN